jgi:hypothetical protein
LQTNTPEKRTPVEQDNNKTPNENSQDEPSSEQDNNETPDQQQEDNAVTEQTNTPKESTPVTQDNNETKTQQQQKTNNKDTDQASGGKPKEQSSTAKTKRCFVVVLLA